jgi:hypothetical protein
MVAISADRAVTVGTDRIALASYPRSGNTWVRFLLEAATGERCGSIYNDRVMPRGGRGIVIKTHGLDSARYASAIHLVRNPFDAIESHFHWKRDIGGNRTVEWNAHVAEGVEAWDRHTAHWLDAPIAIHRIRYEELHAAPGIVLRQLLQWLGRSVPDAVVEEAVAASGLADMRQLHPTLGPRFFRRGEVGASYAAFSNEQTRTVVQRLGPLLQQLGYADVIDRCG